MLLAARRVTRAFGGVDALRGADIVLREGEIHALAGANGSGKSTLLGVLSGQLRPDAGRLTLEGRDVRFASPRDALDAGIAIVTQETTLVGALSVTENVLLGHRAVRGLRGIDWRASRRRAATALDRLGVQLDVGRRVETLAPDHRQMVEIARALAADARVLVLDEPTSSLTSDRVETLFAVLRSLRVEGVAVVLVSHRVDEMLGLADRVTVLRDGVTVARADADGYTAADLLRDMVGHEDVAAPGDAPIAGDGPPVLVVERVAAPPRVGGVSLIARPGEIVGLAGLVGAGRSELLDALFGLRPRTGAVHVGGRPVPSGSPRASIAAGVAYVTADRRTTGLCLALSVADNLALAATSRHRRWTRRRRGAEERRARDEARRLGLVAESVRRPVATLSGGNQQKVMLGKWLATSPRVLLLDEPTRGVDIAAKAELHAALRAARDRGAAVLVSSSETDELREFCDRVLVMARGQIVGELGADEASEHRLVELAVS